MTSRTVRTSGLLAGLVGLAALAIITILLLTGGDARAQTDPGAVSNLRLSSPSAGELVITWDAPNDTPADYRVVWAPSGEDFPSWKAQNTASKGNAYPTAATHKVTGLASGTEYKARVRSRYASGGNNDGPWSGPWSNTETITISSPPDPTPTATAAPTATATPAATPTPTPTATPTPTPTPTATPEPTPSPTPTATPEPSPLPTATATPEPTPSPTPASTQAPAKGEITGLSLSSNVSGSITVSWNAPSQTPDSYRVIWAKSDLEYLSFKKANETHRGNEYPSGDSTSVTLSGLTQDATYKAKVRARYDSSGSGPWTVEVSGEVATTDDATTDDATTGDENEDTEGGNADDRDDDPPNSPTGLFVSADSHDTVVLSWDTIFDGSVTGYRIYRGTDVNNLPVLDDDTGNTTGSYTDNAVVAETTYFYGVAALNANGASTHVTTSATTLAAPTVPDEPDVPDMAEANSDNLPTGKPNLSAPNAFRVPAVLTADKGNIADADGLTTTKFFFQWRKARTNTPGPGDTVLKTRGETYTLTDKDANTRIYVEAFFRDDLDEDRPENEKIGYEISTSVVTILPREECGEPKYTGGATHVWTGTVTLEDQNGAGENIGFRSGPDTGEISPSSYSVSGRSFTIGDAYMYKKNSDVDFIFRSPAITAENHNSISLHVCGAELPFHRANISSSGQARWSDVDNYAGWDDWSDQTERTIHISRDAVKPTLDRTAVSGTDITMTFSEDLASAGSLANSAFTVKKAKSGVESAVSLGNTAPVISGRTLTLTLATAAAEGDNLIISYTNPTSGSNNKLADKFGNEVDSFTTRTAMPEILILNGTDAVRVPTTLTAELASVADLSGVPSSASAYRWQWIRVDDGVETDIRGATRKTYRLAEADVGKEIKLSVSFRDSGGTGHTLSSNRTNVVLERADCAATSTTIYVSRLWSAKLTLGKDGTKHGYIAKNSGHVGTLSGTNVSSSLYRGTVSQLYYEDGKVHFHMDPAPSEDSARKLALFVCGTPLQLRHTGANLGTQELSVPRDFVAWDTLVDRNVELRADTAPPKILEYFATENQITFVFNEKIDGGAFVNFAPGKVRTGCGVEDFSSSFTVTINGQSQEVAGVSSGIYKADRNKLSRNNNYVTVNLPGNIPSPNPRIGMRYTKPTEGGCQLIRDERRNEMASFSHSSVPFRPSSPPRPDEEVLSTENGDARSAEREIRVGQWLVSQVIDEGNGGLIYPVKLRTNTKYRLQVRGANALLPSEIRYNTCGRDDGGNRLGCPAPAESWSAGIYARSVIEWRREPDAGESPIDWVRLSKNVFPALLLSKSGGHDNLYRFRGYDSDYFFMDFQTPKVCPNDTPNGICTVKDANNRTIESPDSLAPMHIPEYYYIRIALGTGAIKFRLTTLSSSADLTSSPVDSDDYINPPTLLLTKNAENRDGTIDHVNDVDNYLVKDVPDHAHRCNIKAVGKAGLTTRVVTSEEVLSCRKDGTNCRITSPAVYEETTVSAARNLKINGKSGSSGYKAVSGEEILVTGTVGGYEVSVNNCEDSSLKGTVVNPPVNLGSVTSRVFRSGTLNSRPRYGGRTHLGEIDVYKVFLEDGHDHTFTLNGRAEAVRDGGSNSPRGKGMGLHWMAPTPSCTGVYGSHGYFGSTVETGFSQVGGTRAILGTPPPPINVSHGAPYNFRGHSVTGSPNRNQGSLVMNSSGYRCYLIGVTDETQNVSGGYTFMIERVR